MQTRPDRQSRVGGSRDESGTALVELALVIPMVILLLGIAFNGWNAMQQSIRLTSAARAGAIVAASDLSSTPGQAASCSISGQPADDATAAINAEENTNVYQDADSGANDYVSLCTAQDILATGVNGVTINTVTVTISEKSVSFVPFVGSFPVTTHATARYS
jgi:Flp pilus assembly protein TadG